MSATCVSAVNKQSNKFHWSTHKVPRAGLSEEDDSDPSPPESFVIRSLKQGATGAVKTWPVCEVLLDYLVRRGGLRNVDDKIIPGANSGNSSDLDLTRPPDEKLRSCHNGSTYNIVELGAGTGCLGVGLAMALNQEKESHVDRCCSPLRPRKAQIMCTDIDRATIKNMRYNVMQQPSDCNVSKAVRAEPLGWGDDIGGEKFAKAVRMQFRQTTNSHHAIDNKEVDPIRLVTHLIASDVHYGSTTLEPLSSVISAFKLRNPDIIVIVLIKERSPEAFADVAELKSRIEAKVSCGLELEEQSTNRIALQDFSVTVRDVVHRDISNMKMVEC